MSRFLTTNETSAAIENIIRKANEEIILCTPYLKLSKTILERMLDASNKGIKIHLIYREDKLPLDQKAKLGSIKSILLYSCENLHAKCYLNENTFIISSMNLHEYSEKHNREMSVIVKKSDNKEMYDEVRDEIKSIITKSTLMHSNKLISDNVKIEIAENTVPSITNRIDEDISEDLYINLFYNRIVAENKNITISVYDLGSDYDERDQIEIQDFPLVKLGINIFEDSSYIQYDLREFRRDKLKEFYEITYEIFRKQLKDYRVFWDSPFTKLNIYFKKNLDFEETYKGITSKVNYLYLAFKTANSIFLDNKKILN